MKVKLVCIATRKYIQYTDQFIASAQKYFFPHDDVNIVIFSDAPSLNIGLQQQRPGPYDSQFEREFTVTDVEIPSYGFPEATLLRYHIFSKHAEYLHGSDYVFYADIDSKFVDYVGKDDLLAECVNKPNLKYYFVQHPGFWDNGRGSWEDRSQSLCCVPHGHEAPYVAGGFLGARTKDFLSLSGVCSELIRGDLRKGITPVWHDESALNKFVSCIDNEYMLLPPCYVYPEERPDWFTWTGTPRILALKKNHAAMRL